jgi:para-nitrobenzyl esterase
MKHIFTLFLIGITIAAGAQCSGNRYVNQIFPSVDATVDITYGNNINQAGAAQSLELDVYEGTGDIETSRPLLIMAHGGSFIGGSKEATDVVDICTDFAKMGYVCTSIEYRIGMDGIPFPGPDSVDATESVIRAFHDMKAAIRFFYKDARENGNNYGIDTNQIFIGGSSAGAIAAVHVAYLDDISELPIYVDTTAAGLGGGIAGQSGNSGYSSEIQGVISLAGALRDTSWIDAGDPPIISIHADGDATVPYGTALISLSGIWDIVTVSGSGAIHPHFDNLGITNCLHTVVGGTMHPVHAGGADHYDTTIMYVRNFLSSMVCGTALDCFNTASIVGLDDLGADLSGSINVYPNPVENQINIDLSDAPTGVTIIKMFDALGKVVYQQSTSNERIMIDASKFESGIYMIDMIGTNWTATKKVVK